MSDQKESEEIVQERISGMFLTLRERIITMTPESREMESFLKTLCTTMTVKRDNNTDRVFKTLLPPRRKEKEEGEISPSFLSGAGDGIRTRDPQLGKLVLYH